MKTLGQLLRRSVLPTLIFFIPSFAGFIASIVNSNEKQFMLGQATLNSQAALAQAGAEIACNDVLSKRYDLLENRKIISAYDLCSMSLNAGGLCDLDITPNSIRILGPNHIIGKFSYPVARGGVHTVVAEVRKPSLLAAIATGLATQGAWLFLEFALMLCLAMALVALFDLAATALVRKIKNQTQIDLRSGTAQAGLWRYFLHLRNQVAHCQQQLITIDVWMLRRKNIDTEATWSLAFIEFQGSIPLERLNAFKTQSLSWANAINKEFGIYTENAKSMGFVIFADQSEYPEHPGMLRLLCALQKYIRDLPQLAPDLKIKISIDQGVVSLRKGATFTWGGSVLVSASRRLRMLDGDSNEVVFPAELAGQVAPYVSILQSKKVIVEAKKMDQADYGIAHFGHDINIAEPIVVEKNIGPEGLKDALARVPDSTPTPSRSDALATAAEKLTWLRVNLLRIVAFSIVFAILSLAEMAIRVRHLNAQLISENQERLFDIYNNPPNPECLDSLDEVLRDLEERSTLNSYVVTQNNQEIIASGLANLDLLRRLPEKPKFESDTNKGGFALRIDMVLPVKIGNDVFYVKALQRSLSSDKMYIPIVRSVADQLTGGTLLSLLSYIVFQSLLALALHRRISAALSVGQGIGANARSISLAARVNDWLTNWFAPSKNEVTLVEIFRDKANELKASEERIPAAVRWARHLDPSIKQVQVISVTIDLDQSVARTKGLSAAALAELKDIFSTVAESVELAYGAIRLNREGDSVSSFLANPNGAQDAIDMSLRLVLAYMNSMDVFTIKTGHLFAERPASFTIKCAVVPGAIEIVRDDSGLVQVTSMVGEQAEQLLNQIPRQIVSRVSLPAHMYKQNESSQLDYQVVTKDQLAAMLS